MQHLQAGKIKHLLRGKKKNKTKKTIAFPDNFYVNDPRVKR